MSEHPRPLPGRPSLRHLKLEAKRRLRAGEFTTLHDAQAAVARAYGRPGWTALKRFVQARAGTPYASAHLRWIADRFGGAGTTGWAPPGDAELHGHLHERLLGALPPGRLLPMLTAIAGRLRDDLVLVEDTPTHALVRLDDGQLQAVAEAQPPYRLVGLRAYGHGTVSDPRLAAPGTITDGDVPAAAQEVAASAFAELRLAGLALAGADDGGTWTLARGWARLDPAEPLTPRHRFPAGTAIRPVTATAALRLVADGRLALDAPVHRYLDAAPDGTVRDLLIADPGRAGDDGRAEVLRSLVAEVTGLPFGRAVTALVLEPLGMDGSTFAASPPSAVTGYAPGPDGPLEPVTGRPEGLWTTAGDLARFGRGWHTLLPAEPARAALTPQVELPGGGHAGLGWLLDRTREIAGCPGTGPGAAASLVVRLRDGRVHAALSNRDVPVEPVNGRVLRATT